MERVTILALLGIVAARGVVRPATAEDNPDILQRFDIIEKRLSNLEQQVRGGAAAPAQETAAARSPPKRGKPGWRIDVYPYTKDGPVSSPIVRQTVGIGPIFFAMHLDTGGPNRTPVQYRGTAFFNANEAGNYTFNIAIASIPTFSARGP